MQLYCVSNVIVSFVLTSFLGINYCLMPENEISGNGEVAVLDTEVEPLSQKGEEDKNVVTEVKKETKTPIIENKQPKKKRINIKEEIKSYLVERNNKVFIGN